MSDTALVDEITMSAVRIAKKYQIRSIKLLREKLKEEFPKNEPEIELAMKKWGRHLLHVDLDCCP